LFYKEVEDNDKFNIYVRGKEVEISQGEWFFLLIQVTDALHLLDY
jgi:hypothetical protein